MSDRLLEAHNLRKAFGGIRAVDDVSLTLPAGEMRALIGPNGAGKTTLFHLLTGLVRPDAGTVHFRGDPITALAPRRIWRRGLSRTFQLPEVFAHLSARENVQVALLAASRQTLVWWRAAMRMWREQAEHLLAEVGLGEQASREAGTLSYGDQKRLELAIALANDPVLLLLDEPTAGLAPQERRALMELIRQTVSGRGVTVFFTEHDMDVVFAMAQAILVMHQGKIIASGTPEEVRANAEVQRVYLGAPR
jgi:branched-chain amino acid transport system ATP-binding protein